MHVSTLLTAYPALVMLVASAILCVTLNISDISKGSCTYILSLPCKIVIYSMIKIRFLNLCFHDTIIPYNIQKKRKNYILCQWNLKQDIGRI